MESLHPVKSIDTVESKLNKPNSQEQTNTALENSIKGLKNVFEKITSNKIARRIVKTFEVFALAIAIDHAVTRYEVKEEMKNNEIEYSHEDERTSHYINIMAGKDTFDQDDVDYYTVSHLKTIAQNSGVACDLSENSTREDILAYLQTNHNELHRKIAIIGEEEKPEETIQKFSYEITEAQEKYRDFFQSVDDENNFYKVIWEIEKECGNPKIRFTEEEKIGLPGFAYNQHYNPATNTLYISPLEFIPTKLYEKDEDGDLKVIDIKSKFIAEASHGKQFTNPVQWIECCGDIIQSFYKANFNCEKAYKLMVNTPGFYEHEAHEEIQPTLENKLKPFIKE